MKEILDKIDSQLNSKMNYIISALLDDYNMENMTKIRLNDLDIDGIKEHIVDMINSQIEMNDN